MLPTPPAERIALPAAPAAPARPAFPWVATIAPVAVSVVLWAVTQSVLSLLFALLGPVVAVGGVLDGRRTRRRTARDEGRRFSEAITRAGARIDAAHARERQRLSGLVGLPARPRWDEGADRVPVRVGWGRGPAVVELTGGDDEPAFAPLRSAASAVDACPLLLDATEGIGVVGPPVAAAAVARAAAVQVAAWCSPAGARLSVPVDEDWALELPHAVQSGAERVFRWTDAGGRSFAIGWADDIARLPAGCTEVVDLGRLRPAALTRADAARAAAQLAQRADALGHRRRASALPASVAFGDLGGESPVAAGLEATVGVGDSGPVRLDLVAEGPHALVAGTTGSGKSELLVSWILGMASGRSPAEVAFVLIDFKGGAAFAPLAPLPHVLATLTDLDTRLTRRAALSLRAELLHRERVLAEHAARAIDELAPGVLPRLVIVVDEFAAMVADAPDLHDLFADLAARGRSLGMHLVLCTQRPAGVVRDAVLANVGLRVALRVTDRADSLAITGSDAAARLPAEPRGRAVVLAGGTERTIQVALAAPSDVARIASGTPADARRRPWCDPLPADLRLASLPGVAGGVPFGLADRPAEQSQPVAVYEPAVHGHLLVLGGPGAGLTTAATVIAVSARRAGMPVHVLSADPADAWGQLSRLQQAPPAGSLLIADDLDALLARVGADHQHEFAERVAALLRGSAARSVAVVVTARRLAAPLAGWTSLFGSRLVLRQASREDHALAGGASEAYDPRAIPGRGTWRGDEVQVARELDARLPAPEVPVLPVVDLSAAQVLALVTPRPRTLVERLRGTGAHVVVLGADRVPDSGELRVLTAAGPTVIIGDADAWQADWTLLTTARREWPILLAGCTVADHRALLRHRDPPPPLGDGPGECWLASLDGTARAVLRLGSASDSEENTRRNR